MKNSKEVIVNTVVGIFLISAVLIVRTILAATVSSSVIVGNAAPTASAVLVNAGASPITLNAGATTTVLVTATIVDNNGCSDVFSGAGTTTVYLFRSGFTSSSCIAAQNPLNCYKGSFQQNSCVGTSTTAVATSTFSLQYFAQATDSSSSFPGQFWMATVIAQDGSNSTSSADSPQTVVLNTLTSINLTTTTISYGIVPANTNTGSTNQQVVIQNYGNSSTTALISASQTLTSGANIITTSSQTYASSSFTYGSGAVSLSGTPTAFPGVVIAGASSTATSSRTSFWGLAVPPGTPTGTYSGVNVFTALFQ